MNGIGDRVKQLRLHFDLTQLEFGNKINLSQNYVWMIETNKRMPSPRTISDICREFGVNELWLRHGDEGGPMFKELSRKDAIAAYMGKLLSGERSELEEKLIDFMAATDVEQWDKLLELIRPLATNISQTEKPPRK